MGELSFAGRVAIGSEMSGVEHKAATALQRSWRGHGVRAQHELEVARALAELQRLGWQPVPKGQSYVGYRHVHAATGLSSGLGARQLLQELLHDEKSPLRSTVPAAVEAGRAAAAAERELLGHGWATEGQAKEGGAHRSFVHHMSGQRFSCPNGEDARFLLALVSQRQNQQAAEAEELSSVATLPASRSVTS